MAIPWLIGGAVLIAGVVSAALSDDDSSSSTSTGYREVEQEKERAEAERKIKLEKAKLEQYQRQVAEQNRAHANRLINKYSLSISADSLISASKNGNLEISAVQAFQESKKSIQRKQQIERISKQLEEMKQLENDLINL
ncbi:hypothetical protein LDJ79_16745 [Vibrio tritonius]|uniref:DNA repair protein n=1 Tax=Vibrio tritonius TaxID=1435069 RepID=A0ABS7YQ24_9VIBR|nr:hypothetical protein [Vibrio tritonius]MCA2017771.1 hypothetical protein [Vibrio tritonius]